MQTSGTCGPLSDGVRKTIVGAKAPTPAKPAPMKPAPVGNHRRGGFAKHSKGGK